MQPNSKETRDSMNSLTKGQDGVWPKGLIWLLAIAGILIIAIKYTQPVGSPDLWWHLALGRHILESGQLIVDHSIFSWTETVPFVYNAWISEILLYLIYEVAGPHGMIALRFLTYGAFFALAIQFSVKRGIAANPLAWLIIINGLVLAGAGALVKPELFSLFFMCVTVWLYFTIRAAGVKAWPSCYLFPLIIVVWVNTHGAFVLSSLLFLTIGLGELLNARFSPGQAMPLKLRVHLLLAFTLCIPALLINPYGYELPLTLIQNWLFNPDEALSFREAIYAYMPTSRHNGSPFFLLDYFSLAGILFVFLVWQKLKVRQVDWVVILAFLAYSWFFMLFIRSSYTLAPVFVFTALDLLAKKGNSWAWPGGKKGKVVIAVSCVALISAVGLRATQGNHYILAQIDFSENSQIRCFVPTEETDFIAQLPSVKKLGNTYADGGYLMYRLWPSTLVTVDPRYFPFKAWINQLFRFASGIGIQSFIDDHPADIWLIPHKQEKLIRWFAQSGTWTPLFIGSEGVVFGPAAEASAPPIISLNVHPICAYPSLVTAFDNTAVALKSLSLAEEIRSAIIANRPTSFDTNDAILNNMERITKALRALLSGNYEEAAEIVVNQEGNIIHAGIAIEAYTLLGHEAWKHDDYSRARRMAVETLGLDPESIIHEYNVAITDWRNKQSATKNQPEPEDGLTWQFMAEIILNNTDKIPQEHAFIVDVATSMREGTLREKPKFLNLYEQDID